MEKVKATTKKAEATSTEVRKIAATKEPQEEDIKELQRSTTTNLLISKPMLKREQLN